MIPAGAHGRGDVRGAFASLAWAGAGALCFMAAFPPIDLWPLVAAVPAMLVLGARRSGGGWRGFLAIFVTQWPMWFWMHRWLVDVTPIGWPLLALFMAFWPALFAALVVRLERSGRLSNWPLAWLIPPIWVGLEYFRSDVFMDGYPWFQVGHPLIGWLPLAQSADLLGTSLLSLLVAMFSGAMLDGLRLMSRGEATSRRQPWCILALVITALLLALNLGYGWWRLNQTISMRPGPVVLAIQTNLPQSNKRAWTFEEQLEDMPRYARQTIEARQGVEGPVDLVVWPETMAPGFGFEPQVMTMQKERGFLPGELWHQLFLEVRETVGAPILVGSPCRIGLGVDESSGKPVYTWEAAYNSAYLMQGDMPYQRYDKIFLTPFGETMPYISHWDWLERQLLALGAAGMRFDLDAGERPVRLRLATDVGEVRLATPICFEDTVARVVRRLVWEDGRKQADLLVNLSNDGWFGDHDPGRRQHVQAARFRSIENRLPMIRCANTGLSVAIDSTGKIIGVVETGRNTLMRAPGHLVVRTTLDERKTLYGRIGNVLPTLCLAATVGLWWLGRRGKETDHASNAVR